AIRAPLLCLALAREATTEAAVLTKDHDLRSCLCRRRSVALALLLASCGGHAALSPAAVRATTADDPLRQTPPPVPRTSLLPPWKLETAVLPNGMTIVVVERRELPLASITWASRAAHDDGSAAGEGLAAAAAKAVAFDDAGQPRNRTRSRSSAELPSQLHR